MPTGGSHITVVEQLALQNPALAQFLGSSSADETTPEGRMMRFAKLGAIGPDLFYMLGDFNIPGASSLQDLENILVKIGGTKQCLSELSEKVNKWLSGELNEITGGIAGELQKTSALISGIVVNGFIALIVDNAFNPWSFFRPSRQRDLPRENWFWADCLHYVYSGKFTRRLLDKAVASNDGNMRAYSLGYLTHYVTDVVGHPFVNQIVQGPFRLHWQRHHLVENYIDAYVWDRWHSQFPEPGGTAERPLDAPVVSPNIMGNGARYVQARLHDHINVGGSSIGDPVDAIVESVCKAIEQGLFDIGILENLEVEAPNDGGFKKWCDLMASVIKDFYGQYKHPHILETGLTPRPGGYPASDDVAGAYGTLRLMLKLSTDDYLEPPVFPDIVGDVTDAINQMVQNVSNDIGGIPPFPTPNTSGSFSFDALLDALADIAQWFGEAAVAVGKAVVDTIVGLAGVAATIVTDVIKIGLWLLNSALYAMYMNFRHILVINAYSTPYTTELTESVGPLQGTDFWISKGNPRKDKYPAEENIHAREAFFSGFHPYVPPALSHIVENPLINMVATYGNGSRPEAFLEAPAGPSNMFLDSSLAKATAPGEANHPSFKDASDVRLGGAIANSYNAVAYELKIVNKDWKLPDYDLDGDRGYAWPGWEVASGCLLDPLAPANAGGVTVKAVKTNG